MSKPREIAYVLLTTFAFCAAVPPANAQFTQQGSKLVGTGAVGLAHLGEHVAISADGNTMMVGGPADNDSAGAVWVYVRSNGGFVQQAKLTGAGAVGQARFGDAFALSADGNTAIIGGRYDNARQGAVWVFTRTGGGWSQQGDKLVGSGGVGAAQQGNSVAVSADGKTAVWGAWSDNNETGAAWVFALSNGVWSQRGGKLIGTAAAAYSGQGYSIAMSGDGSTILVGGPQTLGNGVGASWVFTRSNDLWTQQAKLVAGGGEGIQSQGQAAALSADGNTAMIGAPSEGANGAAWVFTRNGSTWSQQGGKLVGSGITGSAYGIAEGGAVALSVDGNTAIVGGSYDGAGTGATWVFTRSSGAWSQQGEKLVGTGAVAPSYQGIAVALSGDGRTVVVGGDLDNGTAGAAWVFAAPALPVSITHAGSFTQGQSGAVYTISVHNSQAVAMNGTVTVTGALPAGLAAAALSGSGWTCNLASLACMRGDALASGANYPAIALAVNVAPDAPSLLTAQASLTGGGFASSTASDYTSILASFTDVSPGDAFLPAIDLLREYGVTSGCGAAPPQYCPGDNITRGQMAVFVVRAILGGDSFSYNGAAYFTDVPASHGYFKWVQKMRELGITTGCGSTTYCPDDPVTRGQMAVFVIRARYGSSTAFGSPATPLFSDVPASHTYFPWIQKMKSVGITAGCGVATYCPNDPVTRGQMAVFIVRGAFNQLLLAGTPVVASISPASQTAGQSVPVTITGQNTSFSQGISQVNAGAGITAGSVIVTSPTTLTALFTLDAAAVPGPRSVTVTTGSEEATLPNGFTVQ